MGTIWVTSFVEAPTPVYGIWHPYKCTVTITCPFFFLLMVAFCHGIQAADVPMYAFPKLIFIECMLACLLVSASKYKMRVQ